VRRLADGGIIHVEIVADGPHHHLATVEAHANLDRQPLRAPHLLTGPADQLLHGECRIARPHRVVFMGDGSAEQGHDAVAHDLIDGALVAMDRVHHLLQHRIENCPGFFGITVGQEFHGALQVGEEHGDLLALPFQGTARGEDFLSQVARGVAQRCLRAWGQRRRGRRSGW
jgi:hypothetical protein